MQVRKSEVTSVNFTIDTSSIGALLLSDMIKSPKVYYFAVDTQYPSRLGMRTINTNERIVGSHVINNDINVDIRHEFRAADEDSYERTLRFARKNNDPFDIESLKFHSQLPPIGIDSVVVIHPGLSDLNLKYGIDEGRIRKLHPKDDNDEFAERIRILNNSNTMPSNEYYFIAFHELAEAYYKVDYGLPYQDLWYPLTSDALEYRFKRSEGFTDLLKGAHNSALDLEEKWRLELSMPPDLLGGHVNIN